MEPAHFETSTCVNFTVVEKEDFGETGFIAHFYKLSNWLSDCGALNGSLNLELGDEDENECCIGEFISVEVTMLLRYCSGCTEI